MAPRRKPADSAVASAPGGTKTTTTASHPGGGGSSSSGSSNTLAKAAAASAQDWSRIANDVCARYRDETAQPTKLIDAFLAFLVVVGAIQFAYCILAGNFPFNAFLSGFSATVGQFVLAVSLRVQTIDSHSKEFATISPERAFADFVVCSLILHFLCLSYIN